MIWLLLSLALAADQPIKVETGKCVIADEPSFLVADWQFRAIDADALKYTDSCKPHLAECLDASLILADDAIKLTECSDNYRKLGNEVANLTVANLTLEQQKKLLRGQRNTAYIVTGALVTGVVAAAVVLR